MTNVSTGFFGRPEDTEPPIEGTQFTTNDLTTEERLAVEQMIDTVTTINTVTIPQINQDLANVQAEFDGIDAKVAEAAASAASANTSKNAAATSATAANVSATNAASAQALAQTAATNAGTSAGAAASSASAASTSAASASASANASDAARVASQAAQAASETARDASIAAKVASETARDASITAKNASQASATAAATSETNAAAYELSANNWATKTSGPVAGGEYSAKYHAQAAASSASGAASSASAASSSASSASSSATAAGAAQVAAETARDQTLAAYDNFDDRYLGAKTSDPTVDNDGNALIAGTLYFNSTLGYMKVYTGSVWVDAYAAGTSFLAKANNLSDLPSASTARMNLGLGTAATQNTTAFAAASHTHPISDVTNLQSSLDGKAALSHVHAISDVTNLQTSLDAKLNASATTYVQQSGVTGSAYLPAGTTAQRPASPAAGYIRYNSTTGKFEGYGSAWGNIGGGAAIGDTPPANPGAGDLWWNSADGRMYVYYTDANSSQWVDLSAGGAGQYLPLTGGDVTGNVTVTGNFGVGTSSPLTKLQVAGSTTGASEAAIRVSSTTNTNARIDLRITGPSYNYAGVSGETVGLYSANHPMTFQADNGNPFIWVTGGSERARIDSSGSFLIGTTTAPIQSATFRLKNSSNAAEWSVGPNTAGAYLVYNQSSTGVYLGSGSTSWTANSDERLKDIIEPISDAANKVSSLRAVIGKYKTDEENIRRSFLIAQDVQAVFPEAVDVQPDDQGTLGLQYTDLIPLLVAAIKELKAELDTVKSELAQLKGGE